eukprot:1155541-Pelagomonas_calceolata.AAC.5
MTFSSHHTSWLPTKKREAFPLKGQSSSIVSPVLIDLRDACQWGGRWTAPWCLSQASYGGVVSAAQHAEKQRLSVVTGGGLHTMVIATGIMWRSGQITSASAKVTLAG